MCTLTPTNLFFDDNNTPYSARYGDSYFSHHDGLAESRYVFLEGNLLPHAWQNKKCFTIVETGFGSGLNFLTTWQAWKTWRASKAHQTNRQHARQLHFTSIEKHPLQHKQLAQILAGWDELSPLSEQLIHHYPPLNKGIHTLVLPEQVSLTLYFMDIGEALDEMTIRGQLRADAWFLDGFSPAKNPDMWHPEYFKKMYGLSKPGATLATYTAASQVRKGLIAAGFSVEKRKGFGKKREMLMATKPSEFKPVKWG